MTLDDVKIIFVDFDWTIYDHDKVDFDYPSIEALKRAQEKGIKVFLATARSYDSLEHLKFFDLFQPDGMICCNGSVIFYHDEIIRTVFIPKEHIKEICKENN